MFFGPGGCFGVLGGCLGAPASGGSNGKATTATTQRSNKTTGVTLNGVF